MKLKILFCVELVYLKVNHLFPENIRADGIKGRTDVNEQNSGVSIERFCMVQGAVYQEEDSIFEICSVGKQTAEDQSDLSRGP